MIGILKRKIDIKLVAVLLSVMFLVMLIQANISVFAASTFPRQYDLVSINNINGQDINANAIVTGVSRENLKVLYKTMATDLADAPTTAGLSGIYLRDLVQNVTTRVDKSQSGILSDGTIYESVLSESGRFVAFVSNATNLIDGTTYSNARRVYMKDMQTNTVMTLTPTVNTADPNYFYTNPVSISNDGRFIAIQTKTVNQFIPGTRPASGYYDALNYDTVTSSWTLINTPLSGSLQNISLGVKGVSCDGSLISFMSDATNLTSNYSGSGGHIYLADIRNGNKITDVTPGSNANGDGNYNFGAKVSCNGRYLVYSTKDRTLISPTPTGINSNYQLVRYDRFTGERIYIGSDSNNTNFIGASIYTVTDQGDAVVSYGSKIYFKHLSDGSGTLEPVQHNSSGLDVDANSSAVASPDGKYVTVSSNDALSLGLSVSPSASSIYNIIRIKTGL